MQHNGRSYYYFSQYNCCILLILSYTACVDPIGLGSLNYGHLVLIVWGLIMNMLIAMHIWLVIICGSICCLTMCNFLHFLTSFPLSSFLQFLAHYSFSRFLISSFPHFLDSMHFLISCISHPAFRPTLVYQARPSLNLQKSERRSSIRY